MILTGKAKEDFIQWSRKEYDKDLFCAFTSMPETSQNALIIERFDSVGIKIFIVDCGDEFYFKIKDYTDVICVVTNQKDISKTRSEATEQAIIKANEIINNLNK